MAGEGGEPPGHADPAAVGSHHDRDARPVREHPRSPAAGPGRGTGPRCPSSAEGPADLPVQPDRLFGNTAPVLSTVPELVRDAAGHAGLHDVASPATLHLGLAYGNRDTDTDDWWNTPELQSSVRRDFRPIRWWLDRIVLVDMVQDYENRCYRWTPEWIGRYLSASETYGWFLPEPPRDSMLEPDWVAHPERDPARTRRGITPQQYRAGHPSVGRLAGRLAEPSNTLTIRKHPDRIAVITTSLVQYQDGRGSPRDARRASMRTEDYQITAINSAGSVVRQQCHDQDAHELAVANLRDQGYATTSEVTVTIRFGTLFEHTRTYDLQQEPDADRRQRRPSYFRHWRFTFTPASRRARR